MTGIFSSTDLTKCLTLNGHLPPWLIVGEVMASASCLIGDRLLEQVSSLPYHTVSRALTDTFTHGLVAFFSWMVVCAEINMESLTEMTLCLLMAMFIDIDHFIAAKSFSIHDATSLAHRPPFHNSSLIIVGTLILFILAKTWPQPHLNIIGQIPYIFFIAWSSHHIRDAYRRGLWFWPLGSTKPLHHFIYIASTMLLPVLMRIFLLSMSSGTVLLKQKSSGSGIFNV